MHVINKPREGNTKIILPNDKKSHGHRITPLVVNVNEALVIEIALISTSLGATKKFTSVFTVTDDAMVR